MWRRDRRGSIIHVDEQGTPLRPAILWLDQRRAEVQGRIKGPWGWLFKLARAEEDVYKRQLLLFGFAVRWISIPLIVTMLVAIFAVHWPYGWQAIADPSAPFANERVLAAAEKLERARSILREHGNYDWLTASGKFVVLNNGIEFAATYPVSYTHLPGHVRQLPAFYPSDETDPGGDPADAGGGVARTRCPGRASGAEPA